MRRTRWVLVFALVGCVHEIPLAPVEQCATQAMVVDGVSFSSGESRGIAYSGGTWAGARAVSYGQGVSCRRPTAPQDMCEVRAAQASGTIKASWDPSWRNLVIGLGTVALVLPGIVASIVFHVSRDNAQDEAAAAYTSSINACVNVTAPPASYTK